MNITPNIFEFATSELSQDAFISYLLAFGQSQFNGTEEYKVAHDFLKECGINGEDVKEIKRQYNKIDVLVVTDNHLLIIEDKIATNEHDDQIIRYVEALKKDEAYKDKKENIKVCYFKTDDYLRHYITTNKNILAQKDCNSLDREYILRILQNIRKNNLIFDSFCTHWETPDSDIDENDLSTWTRRTWFKYLKGLFKKYHIDDNNKECDINHYVSNPSGGFLSTHFDWKELPLSQNIEDFYNKEQKKAGTYKQIELFFSDGRTSRINLAHRFYSNNWDRNETEKYKNVLIKLQEQNNQAGYINQNRIGQSTAYKVMIYGNVRGAYKKFINKTTTPEILQEIEKFISNQS